MGEANTAPLAGCRVVVTRERPGRLAAELEARGADVVHVPLIAVVDADDGGAALAAAFADPSQLDWVLVTSAPGAERIAPHLTALHRTATSATTDAIRVGCVGSVTADRLTELTGRRADLVPGRQLATELAARFNELHAGQPQRVLVAQGDLASPELTDRLRAAGHLVEAVTAYRTCPRRPSDAELRALEHVDAVLFASGSAAAAWVAAFGDRSADLLPDLVVSIGPSTTASALDNGLKVTAEAADHSVSGIVATVESEWRTRRPGSDDGDPVA